MLILALLPAPGASFVVVAHAAFDHHHHHELHGVLEAALHGHTHEAGVPIHEHRYTAFDQERFARTISVAGRRTISAGHVIAWDVTVSDVAQFRPLSQAQGAGPPDAAPRSPILRI